MERPWAQSEVQTRARLYLSSYQRLFGRSVFDTAEMVPAPPLSDPSVEASLQRARMLFEAPFVAVSHDGGADPVFNFGNQTALQLWEMSWEQFTQLPSRLSAEPDRRQARERLLQSVREKGFATEYSGIRASRTGRRFRIENVTVWNVHDESGVFHGQAACYANWTFL